MSDDANKAGELIEVTRADGWAILRIARENKRNAMDRATRTAMMKALHDLRDVSVVIVTGTGGSFCAGLDLKERKLDRQQGIDTAPQEWIDLNLAIRSHPAIFIAAVNGVALGGGSTLINVCDLAVASSDASIGCPEMTFATYPGMAGPAAQLSGITRKRAAWMILTANRIDAATAERWGMVNEVVAPERLLDRAKEIAVQLAGYDRVALAESKQALDAIPGRITEWSEAMDYGQIVNRTIRQKLAQQKD